MAKYIDYTLQECECECDRCGNREWIQETTDYKEINDELRSLGWIIVKVNGEWLEFCCRECYNLYVKNNYDKGREV